MKKLVFIIWVIALFLVSCGKNEAADIGENPEVVSEKSEEGENNTVNKYFELCKVETITEDKVILYSEDEDCYYEIDSSEAGDLIEGEYYDVEFTNRKEIDKNKYSIEGATFCRENFRVQVIKNN